MPNRISQKLWPVEYWQNKKRQFMAGSSSRNILQASGLGILALVFAVAVVVGVITARPYEQAKQIPLRPLPEEHLLPSKIKEEPLPTNKPVVVRRQVPEVKTFSPTTWPVTGRVNHEFGWQQHPVLADWRYNTGVDLSADIGQPVLAAISGSVKAVSRDGRNGMTVVISSDPWTVLHGSLSSIAVKVDDTVIAGQTIGQAGTTFREPYPHVHLAIKKNGQYVNPTDILPTR